jgi:hypothetical protein
LVDDPGNITIRLSGTGPIAQAATPDITTSSVGIQVIVSAQPSIIDPLTNQFAPSTRFCSTCSEPVSQ